MQVNYNGRFSFSTETTKTDFITSGYDAAKLVDGFMRSYNGNSYTRYTEDDYKELEARRYDKTENPERRGRLCRIATVWISICIMLISTGITI